MKKTYTGVVVDITLSRSDFITCSLNGGEANINAGEQDWYDIKAEVEN